jgi:hypothetical protein
MVKCISFKDKIFSSILNASILILLLNKQKIVALKGKCVKSFLSIKYGKVLFIELRPYIPRSKDLNDKIE